LGAGSLCRLSLAAQTPSCECIPRPGIDRAVVKSGDFSEAARHTLERTLAGVAGSLYRYCSALRRLPALPQQPGKPDNWQIPRGI